MPYIVCGIRLTNSKVQISIGIPKITYYNQRFSDIASAAPYIYFSFCYYNTKNNKKIVEINPLTGFGVERTPAAWFGVERTPAAWLGVERTPAAWFGVERTPAAWFGVDRTPAAWFGVVRTQLHVLELRELQLHGCLSSWVQLRFQWPQDCLVS